MHCTVYVSLSTGNIFADVTVLIFYLSNNHPYRYSQVNNVLASFASINSMWKLIFCPKNKLSFYSKTVFSV